MSEKNRFSSKSPFEHNQVLILDDNPSIIKMLTKLLEKLGYIVNSAQSGEELIEIFQVAQTKGITYKFLILDIVIPNGMSGDLALKEILKIDPTVKAIVSSGYSQNPVMSKYQKYGFAGGLTKPYTVDELKNAIADF